MQFDRDEVDKKIFVVVIFFIDPILIFATWIDLLCEKFFES